MWSVTGGQQCLTQDDWKDKPCKNFEKGISESDQVTEQISHGRSRTITWCMEPRQRVPYQVALILGLGPKSIFRIF